MSKPIKKSALITSLGIVVLATGCTATLAFGQVKEAAEIESVAEQYRQAWQRGDLDRVMQFWSPDAMAIGSSSVAVGAAAIRAALQQSLQMGIHDLRHEDREVYGGGDTVVEVTRSVLYDRAGKPMLTMRYMTLWRKSGGQWRIHRDFNVPIGVVDQP